MTKQKSIKTSTKKKCEMTDRDFESINDIEHVRIHQLIKLTGKPIATIFNWVKYLGMPRNPDRSFNLRKVVSWYKEHRAQINAKAANNKKIALELTEIFGELAEVSKIGRNRNASRC